MLLLISVLFIFLFSSFFSYNVAMTDLNNAQRTLDEKEAELAVVQAQYDKAMAEKQTLLDDAEACRRKMNNATGALL